MLLAMLLSPAVATADQEPSQASWTWAEWQVGPSWATGLADGGVGLDNSLKLGIGGRLFGSALRGFLFAGAGLWQLETRRDTLVGPSALGRTLWHAEGGVRLLWPLFGDLRAYVDSSIGYGLLVSAAEVGPRERYDVEVGGLLIGVGGGLQWRGPSWLSIGARVDWLAIFPETRVDFAGMVTGAGAPEGRSWGRVTLALTTTLHF